MTGTASEPHAAPDARGEVLTAASCPDLTRRRSRPLDHPLGRWRSLSRASPKDDRGLFSYFWAKSRRRTERARVRPECRRATSGHEGRRTTLHSEWNGLGETTAAIPRQATFHGQTRLDLDPNSPRTGWTSRWGISKRPGHASPCAAAMALPFGHGALTNLTNSETLENCHRPAKKRIKAPSAPTPRDREQDVTPPAAGRPPRQRNCQGTGPGAVARLRLPCESAQDAPSLPCTRP